MFINTKAHSKERDASNPNNNPNYSATKSQANLTNNNFAKFSSSGYTNNAFLLMSGHHDFTQADFNNQSNGDINFKSTSKSRKMPAQPNFGMLAGHRHNNSNE